MEKLCGHTLVSLELTDLTKVRVEALVNAANPSLMGGGGVDGAIHRAGGPAIREECARLIAKIGRLEPGRAVITTGGRLPAKNIIHTVGPIWRGGERGEEAILVSAYRESLKLADKMALRSLAFPSISTGAYGYPLAPAARVAVREVKKYLISDTLLDRVVFALFAQEALDAYLRAWDQTG
jgi:O-acetyl-ADP-ribose deacetylase